MTELLIVSWFPHIWGENYTLSPNVDGKLLCACKKDRLTGVLNILTFMPVLVLIIILVCSLGSL
jgi:hypothetical protein